MKHLIGVTRPNFLTLTLVCIFLAYALSVQQDAAVSGQDLLLVVLLALAAHVSVNAFNEYFDFKSGLDFLTKATPFSGGSGTLIESPQYASSTLFIAVAALLITVACGLLLAWLHSWHLLWLGVLGVVIIYTYTQYLNRSPFLCWLAPGLGFGLCMTLGAAWVLSGQFSIATLLAALIMTLLVSNLLLLNQFPDIEADRQVGRRHLPIVYGRVFSSRVFALTHGVALLLLIVGVAVGVLPAAALLGLLALPLAVWLVYGVLKQAQSIAIPVHLLALNVACIHVLPLGMAIGLLLSTR